MNAVISNVLIGYSMQEVLGMPGDSPDITYLYKNKQKRKFGNVIWFRTFTSFLYESYGSNLLKTCEGITENTCFSLP